MTGGFEEWAAARTPSLLAFAHALVEDDEVADGAVTRALARIRTAWPRVARDDPDVEARRQVVRACSTPRRAAVVLRVLEERSDGEIAEVLGCSESAARRHVQRGLAEAHRQPHTTDPRSATSARDRVVARAGSAPTQLLTRVPDTRSAEAPPRRRRGAMLAACAVVALVGGVALVSHASRTPDGVIRYPHVDVPESWRYESYAGVELQVPDTWGWGGSPVRSGYFAGPRHLGACGTNQALVPSPTDPATYASLLSGFVGRPAIMDRRCVAWGADGSMPAGDAVWFGSPLAVGVRSAGSTVAETREVGQQRVTVFSADRDLRRKILGTAEQVDVDHNGCPARPVVRPTAGPHDLEPASLSVCIYSQDTGAAVLMWSGTVPQDGAAAYAEAVGAAADGAATCPTPTGRWAALGLNGDGGTRWDLVNLGCTRIELAAEAGAAMSKDTVRSWAYGGATAYLTAPRDDPSLQRYFAAPAG